MRTMAKYRGRLKGFVTLMACFYLLALVQFPVLELGHTLSHSFAISKSNTHSHLFFKTHEASEAQRSLEAMAGHDHNMLETLKLVLELEENPVPTDSFKSDLKLDKHFTQYSFELSGWEPVLVPKNYGYVLMILSKPILGIPTPPPDVC